MKTTIFVRILLATLLPLLLVFVLVISTINSIVYMHGRAYARNAAEMATRETAEQIQDKIADFSLLLSLSGRGLAPLDYSRLDASVRIKDYLERLIAADPAFSRAWIAFEPGLVNGSYSDYYHLTLLQNFQGQVTVLDEKGADSDADPTHSPWYSQVLATRQPYLNMLHSHSYGPQIIRSVTMSFPIIRDGLPIGALGLDILFNGLFDPESLRLAAGQKSLLLSLDGQILFSQDESEIGRRLLDYSFGDAQKLAAALKENHSLMEEMDSPFAGGKSLLALQPLTLKSGEPIGYLFISAPLANLYGSTRASMHLIVSTSILGILLLLFSVFVATRSIVRPLHHLSVNFNRVANGDLDPDLAAEDQIVSPDDAGEGEGDPDEDCEGDDCDDEDSGWDTECRDDEEGEDYEPLPLPLPPEHHSSNVVEIDVLQAALRKMLARIEEMHQRSLKAMAEQAEEKAEREKVEAASRAQSNFFASMSHEIRTPMNAILGISEILLHGDELQGAQRKYVNDIKVSSESLLVIINEILDLSKLESGKMTLAPVDFRFLAFLDNISSVTEYLAADKQLNFRVELADDLPHCLFGDDVRLRQILLNLLSNAIKFTRQGSVCLRVCKRGVDMLSFAIADTGQGIKAEDQAGLFEPFKQVDTTRNRAIQGTGLGLSISRSLVELMGGRIELSSEYGKGSEFTVLLPMVLGDEKKCRKEGMEQEIAAQAYAKTLKVLVVDDNAVNRTVAAGLLKTIHGIEPDLAASGREALEMLLNKDYHLIFMDHMMPDMDGVETTAHIRNMGGKYATIPIIALTANAMLGASEMLMAAGMNDFLAKPIVRTELSEILYKWIPPEQRLTPGEMATVKDSEKAAEEGSEDEDEVSEEELKKFVEKVAAVDCLDSRKALEALGEQADIYYDLLNLLRKKVPEMVGMLKKLLADENLREFSIHAHGLKSSLGSAGALELSASARELEAASSKGDLAFCKATLPDFAQGLEDLGGQLNAVYG